MNNTHHENIKPHKKVSKQQARLLDRSFGQQESKGPKKFLRVAATPGLVELEYPYDSALVVEDLNSNQ
jgi:hypothetical protein